MHGFMTYIDRYVVIHCRDYKSLVRGLLKFAHRKRILSVEIGNFIWASEIGVTPQVVREFLVEICIISDDFEPKE